MTITLMVVGKSLLCGQCIGVTINIAASDPVIQEPEDCRPKETELQGCVVILRLFLHVWVGLVC